jgi:hypothetical protein
MSAQSNPPLTPSKENNDYPNDSKNVATERDVSIDEPSIGKGVDLLALQDADPALSAKMHIVNNVREHSHKRHSYVEPLAAFELQLIMGRARLSMKLGSLHITGSFLY